MKILGLNSSSSAIHSEGSSKSWDAKYQIPKLSARSSGNDKDNNTILNTSTTTSSSSSSTSGSINTNHFINNDKLYSSIGNVNNQLQQSKGHSGRASSVSPKYNFTNDGNIGSGNISNYNKDLLIFKSSSSDALPHTIGGNASGSGSIGGQHSTSRNTSFSNPTTPTSPSNHNNNLGNVQLQSKTARRLSKSNDNKLIDFSNVTAYINSNMRNLQQNNNPTNYNNLTSSQRHPSNATIQNPLTSIIPSYSSDDDASIGIDDK